MNTCLLIYVLLCVYIILTVCYFTSTTLMATFFSVVKSNQIKSNQIKSNQTNQKPNQTKPNQTLNERGNYSKYLY